MRTDNVSRVSAHLLRLAQECFSGALQFDYLSDGRGYRKSTPLRMLRAAVPSARNADIHSQDIVRRYLADIATRGRLSSAAEYRLATKACKGDRGARTRLIEHNLSLVVMIARRYRNRALPLLDLIEEGNIGLLRAAEKFDPERGCRFATYAKWWIRQSIELALMTQRGVVRVPVHRVRDWKRRARLAGIAAMETLQPLESNAPLEAASTVSAPEHEQPEWHLISASEGQQLQRALQQLKPVERQVLQARFGLPDDTVQTLQSIGAQLGLSAERVRQIQSEGLRRLRVLLEQEEAE